MNRVTLVLLACVMFLPASVRAQGHMLHGIGPVNNSMGGAGTALPNESLGALMFNPALIAEVKGNQVSFTTEVFRDGLRIDTTVGTLKGRLTPDNQLSVLPAFGWMMRDPSKRMALGFGLLAMAGFSTDYNQDDASILFALPPNGFGRIYTDLRVTKIPVALGFEVTPKLSVGASLNLYMGEFAVAPLPYTFFDVDQAGNRWYEEAGTLTKRFAAAAQVGFLYKATPKMAIGASVTTPQNFKPYEWHSSNANPGSPNYGKASTTRFDLDGPMVVS
ncbi:MAG: outer membrane protein transport protein, partial [Vicinamibacterales bacterium]